MLPSQTVENYLKTIYLAQADQSSPTNWCRSASWPPAACGAGTATTMMKTLAESGLVRYEPYMGVRLTRPARSSPAWCFGGIG
jgi:DtxR family Mn-dependent transcriptional regulator